MRDKVLRWCREAAFFSPGDSVVCALSGGPDSMVLLNVLLSLRAELGITVSAAHYNHKLRGVQADRDEAFVRKICAEWGIPLVCGAGDVAAFAARAGQGIELAARELRYAFLQDAAAGKLLATAHHADDNAETVLLNLLRGTSLPGLCGIPPRRGNIIRPLLPLTRAEILKYVEENGIPYVTDETNQSDFCRRNRLRGSVLPLLRQEQPALAENLFAMTQRLREDEAFLNAQTADALARIRLPDGVSCEKLASLPAALRGRAILKLCSDFGLRTAIGAAHVAAIEHLAAAPLPSGTVSLPGGAEAFRRYDLLAFRKAGKQTLGFAPVILEIPGNAALCTVHFEISAEFSKKTAAFSESPRTFAVKRVMIGAEIEIRSRRSGDVLRLSGGTRSLHRLFIDRKIPAEERDRIPVLTSGGTVFAVFGVGIDPDFLARPGDDAIIFTLRPA